MGCAMFRNEVDLVGGRPKPGELPCKSCTLPEASRLWSTLWSEALCHPPKTFTLLVLWSCHCTEYGQKSCHPALSPLVDPQRYTSQGSDSRDFRLILISTRRLYANLVGSQGRNPSCVSGKSFYSWNFRFTWQNRGFIGLTRLLSALCTSLTGFGLWSRPSPIFTAH